MAELILRKNKGSKLTIDEMDGNLIYLNDGITGSTATLGSKLNISDFNIYSSTTQSIISNNYNNFIIYTANTLNVIDGKLDKTGGIVTGDLTVLGNMVFNGTATTINTQNLLVYDPIIGLALSQSGSTFPTLDAGFIIDRGISGNTGLIWIEENKQFELGYTTGSSLNTNVRINEYGGLKVGNLYTTNNVGIGTAAPTARLHVVGGNILFESGNTVINEGFLLLKRVGNNINTNRLRFEGGNGGDGTIYVDQNETFITNLTNTVSFSRLNFRNNKGSESTPLIFGTNGVRAGIFFSDYGGGLAGGLSFSTNDLERVRITPSGNVSIGITSDLARLHVRGSGTTASSTALRVENSNGISSLIVRDDRRIGVGIDNPSAQFHISGNTSSTSTLEVQGSTNTSATTALTVKNSGAGDMFRIRDDSAVIFGGANTGIFCSTDKGQSINLGAGGLFLGYFATGDLGYLGVPSVTIGRPNNRLLNATTGTQIMGSVVGNYSPTTGTGLFTSFEIIPTINQTGGANGITRGLYVNPTLTSAADFRSIETTAGNVIFNGGNVGLGVTTPLAELHISGTSAFNPLLINTSGGTTGLVVNNNGNVGIGTTTPTFTLDISGSVRSSFSTGFNNTTTDGGLILTNPIVGSVAMGVTSDGALRIKNNLIGTAFINSSGNQIWIQGNDIFAFNNTGIILRSNITNTTSTNDGSLIVRNTVNYTNASHIYNALSITSTITGLAGVVGRGLYVNPTLTSSIDFRAIETTAGNVIFNGGNVGLGVTTPLAELHVSGTSAFNPLLINTSGGTTGLVVNNNGNVGIGTTTPTFTLDVNGSARVTSLMQIPGGIFCDNDLARFRHVTVGVNQGTGGVGFIQPEGANQSIGIRTGASLGGTERLRVTNIGLVGIGTTTPLANLHLSGSTGTPSLIISTTGNPSSLVVTSSGSVGVGVTNVTPSASLQVNSTTQGFLPPRMTGAQAEAIQSPAEGLLIYATDGSGVTITTKGWWGFEGLTWSKLN